MNWIEEFLLILGIAMLPYGIYDIWRNTRDLVVKLVLVCISLGLFAIEITLSLIK
jgi:hypothetical protein